MKTWMAVVAVMMHIVGLAGAGWAAPFTRIVTPGPNQVVAGPDVVVRFEAGGMTLGKNAWNLHFKLDDDPFHVQYDGNHAHTFKNVPPGTHTVRMFAANGMHEAIPGTQSVVTFHVGYGDGANAPDAGQPLLTYNLPQGEYLGVDAGDITVDFLVENVQLSPGGYQVAYYVNGRRFLVQDHCGPRHIKNLSPGMHRIRVELQHSTGDVVPGAFNSEERIIAVSPDSVKKSDAGVYDGYEGLPRLNSIRGSMTMGQDWVASEPVKPLTEDEIQKQDSLTVSTDDGTVALKDGKPVEYPTNINSTDHVETEEIESFTVRDGGEAEVTTGDLDEVPVRTAEPVESTTSEVRPSTTVRKGSIRVGTPQDSGVKDPDEEESPQAEARSGEDNTPETGVSNAGLVVSGSTTSGTRRRADGSVSTLMTTETAKQKATSATLRLEDRPGLRTVEKATTSTLRVTDGATSQPKISIERGTTDTLLQNNDRGTTRPRRERDDRGTTRPRGERGDRGSRNGDLATSGPVARLD